MKVWPQRVEVGSPVTAADHAGDGTWPTVLVVPCATSFDLLSPHSDTSDQPERFSGCVAWIWNVNASGTGFALSHTGTGVPLWRIAPRTAVGQRLSMKAFSVAEPTAAFALLKNVTWRLCTPGESAVVSRV